VDFESGTPSHGGRLKKSEKNPPAHNQLFETLVPPLLLFVIFFTDVLLFLANLHNFFKSASHDPASEIIRGI
jgi:hypothetical protein